MIGRPLERLEGSAGVPPSLLKVTASRHQAAASAGFRPICASQAGRLSQNASRYWANMKLVRNERKPMPQHSFERLFYFSGASQDKLGKQLQRMLVSVILDGTHPADLPLPSSRRLADQLGIARATVSAAYLELVQLGLIVSRQRSGYFINTSVCRDSKQLSALTPVDGAAPRELRSEIDWLNRLGTSAQSRRNIIKPKNWLDAKYCFISGQVDPAMFPLADWRNCSRDSLGVVSINNWIGDSIVEDCDELIEQIRQRLLPRRGISAGADEILVTLGSQNALFLLGMALINSQTVVGLESPGYPDARNIFALRSNHLKHLEIDQEGLCLSSRVAECDYIYVTPSHQAPTTVTMSLRRRQAFLEMAEMEDFIILEDDYDSDVNFDARSLPALKSMDTGGRVVYFASLSKSLAPGLRIGYVVAPKPLIDEMRALRRLMLRHPPTNIQLTLAFFLAQGNYDALALRLRKAHERRWKILNAAMDTHLKSCRYQTVFGGSSVWVEGPPGVDCDLLSREALKHGILIEPGSVYFDNPEAPCRWFRLGYSVIQDNLIEPGIIALENLIVSLAETKKEARA
ncbi:PLP-dependent aminotransferase family protein [Hyphomonas sp. NPDC076900]|uniref:aminotransferase-like domain-containing protein n=1 Tax=unclassified Hyphomonas TaxID=2630699 RepID=UPI003D05955C